MKKAFKKFVAAALAVSLISSGSSSVMTSAQGNIIPDTDIYEPSAVITLGAKPAQVKVNSDYSASSTAVRIKWNRVGKADGYRVYRYNGKKWVKVANTRTTNCRIGGLKSGTKYKFKVKAFKRTSKGTVWGKASAVKNVATKPSTPKFKGFSTTESSVRLNWSKVKCDGYQIFQKVGSKYKRIATVKGSDVTYKVNGLDASTKYSFKIRAYTRDADGKVQFSSFVTKGKTTKTFIEPDDTHFTSAKVDGTSCKLTWKKVDCDGYEIYIAGASKGISESAPLTFFKLSTDISDSSVTAATVSNLCSGSNYCFQILPYNVKSDGTKIYGFYNIKNNPWIEEISTEFDVDEVNQEVPTWETENKKVTVKVNYEESFKCLELVNEERIKAGKEPLVMDTDLLDKAVTRTAENTYLLSWNHIRANGLVCNSLGYGGENGFGGGYGAVKTAENAVASWMGEPAHRDNMLSSAWKSTGLAIAEISDCYGTFVTVVEVFSWDEAIAKADQPVNRKVTKTIEVKKYKWSW